MLKVAIVGGRDFENYPLVNYPRLKSETCS